MTPAQLAREQFEAAKRMLTAVARAALGGRCDLIAVRDAIRAVELARLQLAGAALDFQRNYEFRSKEGLAGPSLGRPEIQPGAGRISPTPIAKDRLGSHVPVLPGDSHEKF